jgi:hypothetical protein
MKKLLLPVVLMLLAGCDYEIPLSQTASGPADPAIAGTWAEPSTDGNPSLLKIKTSGTNYTATYTEGSNTLTFAGFNISAAGLNLIQLELQNADSPKKYIFVKYELTPEGLTTYRLNTDVVSSKCQTADEMISDIAVHRKNPDLFTEPRKFTRSAQQ